MRVTRGGQVVIPPAIQDEAGIYPGTDVDVDYEDGAIVLRRREPDERVREFMENLRLARRSSREARWESASTIEEADGLSRGEQFVRLLADAGTGRMTTDELMELTRGPYDDLDPR